MAQGMETGAVENGVEAGPEAALELPRQWTASMRFAKSMISVMTKERQKPSATPHWSKSCGHWMMTPKNGLRHRELELNLAQKAIEGLQLRFSINKMAINKYFFLALYAVAAAATIFIGNHLLGLEDVYFFPILFLIATVALFSGMALMIAAPNNLLFKASVLLIFFIGQARALEFALLLAYMSFASHFGKFAP